MLCVGLREVVLEARRELWLRTCSKARNGLRIGGDARQIPPARIRTNDTKETRAVHVPFGPVYHHEHVSVTRTRCPGLDKGDEPPIVAE